MKKYQYNISFKPDPLTLEFFEIKNALNELGYRFVQPDTSFLSEDRSICINQEGNAFYLVPSAFYTGIAQLDIFLALAAQRGDGKIQAGEWVVYDGHKPAKVIETTKHTLTIRTSGNCKLADNKAGFRRATKEEIMQTLAKYAVEQTRDYFSLSDALQEISKRSIRIGITNHYFQIGMDQTKEQKSIEVRGNRFQKVALLKELKSLGIGIGDMITYMHLENYHIVLVDNRRGLEAGVLNGCILGGCLIFDLDTQYKEAREAILARLNPKPVEYAYDLEMNTATRLLHVGEDYVRYGDNKPLPINVLRNIYTHLSNAEVCLAQSGIEGQAMFTFGCKQQVPFASISDIKTVLDFHKEKFPQYYEKA